MFEAEYRKQLDAYGPQTITRALLKIAREAYQAPSDRLSLICWEPDPAQCHQSQFANWLLVTTGERSIEIG